MVVLSHNNLAYHITACKELEHVYYKYIYSILQDVGLYTNRLTHSPWTFQFLVTIHVCGYQ